MAGSIGFSSCICAGVLGVALGLCGRVGLLLALEREDVFVDEILLERLGWDGVSAVDLAETVGR